MSKPITLDVSETLLEQAEQQAKLTGQPVESILTEWLVRGAGDKVYAFETPYGNEAVAAELQRYLEETRQHKKDQSE